MELLPVLFANAGLTAGALLLLGLGACGAPQNTDLFRSSGISEGSGGAGNASGAAAYPSAGSGAGSSAGTPEGSARGEESGGESTALPNGGATSGGATSGGATSGAGSSASGGSGGTPHVGDAGKLGQPNTSDSDCGTSGLTGHCYEHCAFQWTGGERAGQWNDRFCLHTIAAICEFDSGP